MPCRFLYSLFILFLFLAGSLTGRAQVDYQRNAGIPVSIAGKKLALAWAGGLNFVQVSAADIDLDGQKDLFLFDRSGDLIVPLIFRGGTDTLHYSHEAQWGQMFPVMHDWSLMVDYNGDGKEDIFTYSNQGFAVYRNVSSGGTLSFSLVTNRVHSLQGGKDIALWVSETDIPAFTDADNDGDMDVLTFGLSGTTVEYHRNLSMETYGIPDSLTFSLETACWGLFSENFSDNSVTLNVSCKGFEGDTENGGLAVQHAGSTLMAFDGDGDGDKDLAVGDIAYANLVYLVNGGDSLNAVMTSQDASFPQYDVSVNLNVFPAAFYVDADHDGKRDLVVAANSRNASENFTSVLFYKNTNTDETPVFAFLKNNLFQDEMIDVGEGAYPVFFDYNADGLTDLVVGNYGYFGTGGDFRSQLALFENTGTSLSPSFSLITRDYLSLSTLNLYNVYPAFGDMDGDGDMDLLIGDYEGMLHYFENSAGPGNPAAFSFKQPNFEGIDVGQFATPQIMDADRDGISDLVIGERNGNLNYFPNLGTASVPQFRLDVKEIRWQNNAIVRYSFNGSPDLNKISAGEKLVVTGSTNTANNGTFTIVAVNPVSLYVEATNTLRSDPALDETGDTPGMAVAYDDTFGDVDVREYGSFTGYSIPFMYDEDGQYRMLVGSGSGFIYRYTGMEGRLDSAFTETDSAYMDLREGERSAVHGADVDGNGVMDLAIGNYRGGLAFFSGSKTDGMATLRPDRLALVVFPNPAADRLFIRWPEKTGKGAWQYRISDCLGKTVASGSYASLQPSLTLPELIPGLYFLTVTNRQGVFSARFTVQNP